MQQTTLENIPLVSADSHVSEPVDLFLERLPGGLKDRGPRIVEEDGQRRVLFPTLEGDTRIKRDRVLSGEDFSAEELKREKKLQKMAESNERSVDPKLRLVSFMSGDSLSCLGHRDDQTTIHDYRLHYVGR